MKRTGTKILLLGAYGAFFAWFYYRYVPLVPAYQAVLAPILLVLAVMTAADARKGLLAFCFVFPLINSLPHFFGIGDAIPHAPTALVAFLAYFLGRLAGQAVGRDAPGILAGTRLGLPLALLGGWGAISALVSFLRYMDFFPFAASGIHELEVNVAGLSAGGARMSVVFISASLLCGIAMFGLFRQAFADRELMVRAVGALTVSSALAFAFGYVQKLWTVPPGNTPYWNDLGQINATFKDPNSLAGFVAAFVPLLLAFAWRKAGVGRWLCLAVGGLGLGLIPLSGSRSGIAAAAVAACVFAASVYKRASKTARRRGIAAIAAVVLLFVAWNVLIVRDSPLTKRLGWSVYQLKEMTAPGDFFNHRLALWSAAGRIFREVPLTGIGLGAFIVSFPDYASVRGEAPGFTDTALNLVFQIGAEMGVVGLALTLAVFIGLVVGMVRIFRRNVRGAVPDRLGLGAVCGLAAFFLSFLFHTYAASFEMQFLFWFLAAVVWAERGEETAVKKPRWVLPVAIGAVVAAGAVFTVLSLGPYSIAARAEKYGWQQDFGFYEVEKDPEVGEFRWTKELAGFKIAAKDVPAAGGGASAGVGTALTIRASNPDLDERPVTVRVYRTDSRFRKAGLLGEIKLLTTAWTRLPIDIQGDGLGEGIVAGGAREASEVGGAGGASVRAGISGAKGAGGTAKAPAPLYLLLEVDRVWVPRLLLGVPDDRTLGIQLGVRSQHLTFQPNSSENSYL